MRDRSIRAPLVFVVASAVAGAAQNPPPQTPQTPVFRGSTFVVPVDVRVVDSSFKPISGLKKEDFTILEDGVPQVLQHFSPVTLTPEPAPGPLTRSLPSAVPQPQNRRVILIVLGRGRLQPPSRGVDAAIRFVKEQLLPQDQVALFGFNRATDSTTDRAYLSAVLERFKAEHEQIDATIRQTAFEDIDYVYGADIPARLQPAIDNLFRLPGAPELRSPPGAAVPDEAQIRADEISARNSLMSRLIAQERIAIGDAPASPGFVGSLGDTIAVDVGFTDFLHGFPRGMQDLTKLYQAIEYLRHVDGEKHLVYISERGMSLPRLENHTSVAAMANDARVVIDTIQTGGLPTRNPSSLEPMFQDSFNITSLQMVSELTGGLSSVYAFANGAMDRIVTATSSSYLLGYTPANANFDGRYRRIEVKVNRRGAKVLWRHGYFARNPRLPFDQRTALTYNRVASAMNLHLEMQDIKFNLNAKTLRDGAGLGVQVDLQIDPARIAWATAGADRTAAIDVAMFVADANSDITGEHWQHLPLRLTEQILERAKKSGLAYAVRIPLKAEPTRLKVIVYDFGSDLLGTGSMRLR
jgi:VWFA-related protein